MDGAASAITARSRVTAGTDRLTGSNARPGPSIALSSRVMTASAKTAPTTAQRLVEQGPRVAHNAAHQVAATTKVLSGPSSRTNRSKRG